MKERAAKILNFSEESPFFGTFHSYFYSVLKRSYEYRKFSIMTKKQKYQNLEKLLKRYYPQMRISNNFLYDVSVCISRAKNDMDISKALSWLGFTLEQFIALQSCFELFNKEQQLMDFDDILLYVRKLLRENTTFLECLREEVKYILVDEFQDVNRIQYELISLLAENSQNVFVVGDDDQSIYKFRGAGEENLRQFEKDFPFVKKIVLDINYRCPKEIVAVSEKLINHNTLRYPKQLYSGKQTEGKIVCEKFASKDEERKYVVKMIKQMVDASGEEAIRESTVKEGISKGKTAILCRTNSQLSYLAQLLKKEEIPFYMKEKVHSFYKLPHIRPIIGYLMFASNVDRSRKRLLSFLNQPMRYISREIFQDWDERKNNLDCFVSADEGSKDKFRELSEVVKRTATMPAPVAISYILKVVGYERFVLGNCRTKEEIERFKSDIEELKDRAQIYTSIREWMEYVRWEEEMEEKPEIKKLASNDAKVFLYTFHGAKGLEFDNVFIPHLNEGSVPYGKDLSIEELEEERRMFYVALTRCSENLYVTFVENGTKKDTVSRFIKECAFTVSN